MLKAWAALDEDANHGDGFANTLSKVDIKFNRGKPLFFLEIVSVGKY
jgi:hypothetical protein